MDTKKGRISATFKAWCGAGSNRRHKDFQSFALPTELPHLPSFGELKFPFGVAKVRFSGLDSEIIHQKSSKKARNPDQFLIILIRMEYRIAQGWKVFITIISASFLIGGIYCLIQGFKPDSGWIPGAGLLAAAFLFGMAALFYLVAVRTLVMVDKDTLLVKRLFNTRTVLLAEIDGWRKGDKDTFFVILKNSAKSIAIPQNIERRKELLEWIMEKYEDVDARERLKETEVLLENEQFGLTREEREARLAMAKKIDAVASVGGFGLFAWSLIFPNPYEVLMIILLLVPWLAIAVTWYYKGLLRLYKKKSSPYPSVVLMMIMPSIAAGFVILRTYHLYGFGQNAVKMLIGGTLLGAVLCIMACRQAIALSGRKTLAYACILVMAGVYFISLLIFSNCYYDKSTTQEFRVEVSHKHKKTGKSTTYYLSLSAWGRFEDGHEVTVSQNLYQSVKVGDSIRVLLNDGKWGVPWYRLKPIEGFQAR